jgi:hypothetical protein
LGKLALKLLNFSLHSIVTVMEMGR